jgi:uncharacterized membrane protein
MINAAAILMIAALMAVLDLPWLLVQGPWVRDFVEDIQGGRTMQTRLWAGVPVYLALGYLVTQMQSAPRAFLAGMCTYAVYDFTQVFALDRYPVTFAVADTLWGGVLMAVTWWVANHFGILKIN